MASLINNEMPSTDPDALVRSIERTADYPDKSLLNQATMKQQIYIIRDMNKKFRLACSQLIMINNLIDEVEIRYHRAQASERRSYRYILRLRLCTLEGVRNQFYEYAYSRADQLEKLQLHLYQQHHVAWSDSLAQDSDVEEEDEDDVDEEDEAEDEEEDEEEDEDPTDEQSFASVESLDSDGRDDAMDFE